MRYLPWILGGIAIYGCGGASGGPGNPSGLSGAAFAGSYTGAWSIPYRGHNGSAAGTISSVGQVSVVENDTVGASSFYISGTIGQGGAFSGWMEASGVQAPVSGTVALTPQSQVLLTFPVMIGSVKYLDRAALVPTSPVPLSGHYTGTWSTPTSQETGTATFAVGEGGELAGSYKTGMDATVILSGIVSGSGRFSGAIFSAGHYFGATGSFSRSGGELVGTLNESISGNLLIVRFVMARA